jgi:hypothetical protein
MFIFDNLGNRLEVTDLEKAIEQANYFRAMITNCLQHQSFVDRQNAYWQDIYEKLLQLRASSLK